MKFTLKKTILFGILLLLQFASVIKSQRVPSGNDVAAQDTPAATEQQPTSAPVPPAATTTTTPPPAVASSTTPEPPKEQTSSAPTPAPTQAHSTTTPAQNTASNTEPSVTTPTNDNTSQSTNDQPTEATVSSKRQTTKSVDNQTNAAGLPTGSTTENGSQTSQTGATKPNTNDDNDNTKTNNTAIIAGSVVGGLVGIALIAGIITWLNRRGGCTSRTRRRDNPVDFESSHDDYDMKMTENHNLGAAGMGAVAGAMHSSDNLSSSSPFQHARRFVPPTSNPTGYINLNDEEYGYHQNATMAGYQPQYQDYNNGATYMDNYNVGQPQASHSDYYDQQGQEYMTQHNYGHNPTESSSTANYQQGAYYSHHPGSNVTSPTLTAAPVDAYRHESKPDQIEQKPNVA